MFEFVVGAGVVVFVLLSLIALTRWLVPSCAHCGGAIMDRERGKYLCGRQIGIFRTYACSPLCRQFYRHKNTS